MQEWHFVSTMLQEILIEVLNPQTNYEKYRLSFLMLIIFYTPFSIERSKGYVFLLTGYSAFILSLVIRDTVIYGMAIWENSGIPVDLLMDLFVFIVIKAPIFIAIFSVSVVILQAAFTFGAHSSIVIRNHD